MGNYFFLQIITVVFLISIITTLINRRVLGLPSAIGVPIVSAIFVFIIQWGVTLMSGNDYININIAQIENAVRSIDFYDFLINGVICFILTASALKVKTSDLREHISPVMILASLSMVLCSFVYAGMMYLFQLMIGAEIPFIVLLLLGAALGATDPIGIKGVLTSVKAPNHLMVKLESESLFNDAFCLVAFMTVLAVIKGSEFSFGGTLQLLGFEIVVAVIIGVFFGKSALMLMKGKLDQESLLMITAVLATGSFLVALLAHASAPIACVIAGLIVGNKWDELLKQSEIDEVNHFWHSIEGIINAFLFTLIGLELFILDLNPYLLLCGVASFFILHISRFVGNFASFAMFPKIWKNSMNGSLTILSWAGVRGCISLALILAVINLPELANYTSFLLGYVFISVLLSGVVCGLGLPSVINAFYHNPDEPKAGFAGKYHQLCNMFNRKNFKYIVTHDKDGKEEISIYNPDYDGTNSVKETDDKF